MAFLVRSATESDLEEMLRVFEQAAAADPPVIGAEAPVDKNAYFARRRELIDCPLSASLVAIDKFSGEVVGTLQARHVCGRGEISGMVVDEKYRRRGVGGALMRAAMVWANATDHIHKLFLEVWSWNEAAIRLYTQAGFEQEGYHPKQWRRRSGELFDSITMGLVLDEICGDRSGAAGALVPRNASTRSGSTRNTEAQGRQSSRRSSGWDVLLMTGHLALNCMLSFLEIPNIFWLRAVSRGFNRDLPRAVTALDLAGNLRIAIDLSILERERFPNLERLRLLDCTNVSGSLSQVVHLTKLRELTLCNVQSPPFPFSSFNSPPFLAPSLACTTYPHAFHTLALTAIAALCPVYGTPCRQLLEDGRRTRVSCIARKSGGVGLETVLRAQTGWTGLAHAT